jgi:hypothetical protein
MKLTGPPFWFRAASRHCRRPGSLSLSFGVQRARGAWQAMFIPRMWFDEVERIGKQRCTPFGYALQGVGDLIGFVGLLSVLGVPLYLAYRVVVGSFNAGLLWLLVVPVALGVFGAVLVSVSWSMARRRGFRYDYERRVSSWVEGGRERSYAYPDWQAEQARRAG